MLISIYSIFLATLFTMMCGLVFHLMIALNGFLTIYALSVTELILNKTVFFIPDFISHLQGLSMYFTIACSLVVIFGSIWINLKHYQLTRYFYGPFGWIWYGFSMYFGAIGWSLNLTKSILKRIFWRSRGQAKPLVPAVNKVVRVI